MSTDSQRTAPGAGGADKPIMAKELVDYFAAQGIEIHYAYARAIIRECPLSIRGRYVRASEAWSWWVLHPEFKPFGVKGPRAGVTRGLAEMQENS